MRSTRACVLALLFVLGLGACTHDYDALREEQGPDIRAGQGGRSGSGGSGGSSGASGTTGGRGGTGSGGSASGGSGGMGTGGSSGAGGGTPMCEPCDALSEGAMSIGLTSCCRGAELDACGIAVDDGAKCHPLDVPGEDDTSCPPVGPVSMRHEGCCRADARCGARFEMLGLGCVAREDIPELLAPNADAMPCELACTEDADCAGVPDESTLCVPTRGQPAMRHCALECKRDGDCTTDLLCALSPDVEQDRLVTFCQPPYGDRASDELCTAGNQCAHGACLVLKNETEAHCSQFCETDADCPDSRPFCVLSSIGRPSGDGEPIAFNVCSVRDN